MSVKANDADVLVARDKAHVKILAALYPRAEIISASEFFDRVRALAYMHDSELMRDDHAPFLIAHELLQRELTLSQRLLPNIVTLYSSCFHGTSSPSEVLHVLNNSVDVPRKYIDVFTLLATIDQRMDELHLANSVRALFLSWRMITQHKKMPWTLLGLKKIALFHLVDLTMLEIEVVKSLSRLGLSFTIFFPFDFHKRNMNVAVDFSARLFEQEEDLTAIELDFTSIATGTALSPLIENLFKDDAQIEMSTQNISLTKARSVQEEAEQVASQIATLVHESPHTAIVVLVRTLDARANLYKQALVRMGVSVRDRKGLALLKAPAGRLFEVLISARLFSLPKKDLNELLHHQLSPFFVVDTALRARYVDLINSLGIDDRLMKTERPSERLAHHLARKLLVATEQQKEDIATFSHHLARIDEVLGQIPWRATLSEYLRVLSALIATLDAREDASMIMLADVVTTLTCSKALTAVAQLELSDMLPMLRAELGHVTVPWPDNPDRYAVELLPVPEALGRRFDQVFIVDIASSRLPAIPATDPLLDDHDRRVINTLMKKTLLRIFVDDPFEPLITPPRQALEPFWFACAIASAQQAVHFSVAHRDEQGREQAPSEFFTWLTDHLELSDNNPQIDRQWVSPQRFRFYQGHMAAIEQTAPRFNFGVPTVLQAFNGRLDPRPQAVLSPTMIEAFYDCRFKGFFQHVVKLQTLALEHDDIDARALGQIAHRALERYFDTSARARDQARLPEIIAEAVHEYCQTNYVANTHILECHQEWLASALASLINDIESDIVRLDPIAREITLKPVRITVDDRRYLIGGRVDRVDKIGEDFLVIDYKLSSSEALKNSVNKRSLLRGHFQAPIYIRLVARHFAANQPEKVRFSFASIRDGEVLPAISQQHYAEIFDRIFDDNLEESLARSIDNIFVPLRRGEIVPSPGEHCNFCSLNFMCRKKERERVSL